MTHISRLQREACRSNLVLFMAFQLIPFPLLGCILYYQKAIIFCLAVNMEWITRLDPYRSTSSLAPPVKYVRAKNHIDRDLVRIGYINRGLEHYYFRCQFPCTGRGSSILSPTKHNILHSCVGVHRSWQTSPDQEHFRSHSLYAVVFNYLSFSLIGLYFVLIS